MEEEKSATKKIYEQVEQYAKTSMELYKLKAAKKASDSFATVAIVYVLWVLASMFFLFVGIAAALYFGEVLGSAHYGFFLVAGIYALVLVVVVLAKKSLQDSITNIIVKQIFKD